MWNIIFVGFVLCLAFTHGDVSHLGVHQHSGYPSHKPDHPLELPQETTDSGSVAGYPSVVPENPLQLPDATSTGNTVTGYPRVVPENPLQIPEASTGNVRNRLPDPNVHGSSSGRVLSVEQQSIQKHNQNHGHHYHGQDGKYNHQDDGSGWDIRKSVPGEPGQDYPVYDSVPTTSFTCKEKAPGYYADEEARCQVFRICTTNSVKTYNSFLCANGSLFNQRSLTCDWWMNVDCISSSDFFYKNQEIGKMPTGPQLMYQVSKMLEAPNKHPYSFTEHDKLYVDQTIADNLIQGTGKIPDVYLPVKQPIPSTTTTTTTTTTTQKPIAITNFNKVDTDKLNVNQHTLQTVKNEEEERGFKEKSIQSVKNKYIPPVVPTVDQSSLTNVKTHQNKVQVGENIQEDGKLHVSPFLQTSPELHVSPSVEPKLHLSKQNTVISNPQPLLVSRLQDNKLSTSELSGTTNQLFVSPEKQKEMQLFLSSMLSSHTKPSPTDGQLFTSQLTQVNNPQPLFVSQVVMKENMLFTSPERPVAMASNNKTLFISSRNIPKVPKASENMSLSQIDQSSTSGLTGYDYQKQVPVSTAQVTSQVTNQQTPSVTVTKEQTQVVTHSQKTTHVFQNVEDGPNKISLLQNGQNSAQTLPQVNTAQQPAVQQQNIIPSTVLTFTGTNRQQQEISQPKQAPSTIQTFTGSNIESNQFVPDVTKELAFQQIDNIQSELQQITKQQEQQNVINSGLGILTPRKLEHTNLAPDFGQNFGVSQFQDANINYQNIPQGFTHQGVQPNLYPEQNFPTGGYIQNQGYNYQQPNFQEQNHQNYNFHGQQSGDNFNIQVSKNGSAQNFNGESLSQHSNGQTHSSFSGHNVAFKELTKVDIVPSLGFHLNDDYEKNRYISAILSGLIHEGPSYQTSGSSNFEQNQFVPSDVRFSSYQGPSSYLAPQASVQRLPSDSGYYR